jgi:hypothetical protein
VQAVRKIKIGVTVLNPVPLPILGEEKRKSYCPRYDIRKNWTMPSPASV